MTLNELVTKEDLEKCKNEILDSIKQVQPKENINQFISQGFEIKSLFVLVERNNFFAKKIINQRALPHFEVF
jgi:hypothetical protein